MDLNRAATPTPGGLQIENLPVEAFQHICRFCTLHELAALRTLSKRVRDLVDNSLTSRKTFATPSQKVQSKAPHDRHACYVRIILKREHEPINVVFSSYNKEHNYLEFTQKDTTRVRFEDVVDSTLGQLDFNNWEEQLKTAGIPPPSSLSQDSSSTTGQRPRRSSITQAGAIRATQAHIEQELNNGGPIAPMPTSRPTLSSFFGSSANPSSPASTTTAPAAAGTVRQGVNFMAQYLRSALNSTGPQTGLSTEQLTQEALRAFHSVENEVLSSKKQYKFMLSEGTHYIGDDEFIVRYTIKKVLPQEEDESALAPHPAPDLGDNQSNRPHLELKVDYIRASWRWISSGAPHSLQRNRATGKIDGQSTDDGDNRQPWEVLLDPMPELRIGRMYAHRYNLLLEEIGRQDVRSEVKRQLSELGYNYTCFSKDFIYANLRDEHVLRWITMEHFEEADAAAAAATALQQGQDRKDLYDDWEMVENMSTSIQLSQYRAEAAKAERNKIDREALQNLVESLGDEMGYLTARNILEEMLAYKEYSRDLIWKYGVVRREMMGPVPNESEARKLLNKVTNSEASSSSRAAHVMQL
ncbi:hypothetical protein FBU30_005176 [Linnemannia zychae]|nr:hypothetical protein FBU30_005176 [Linnemannia zychae]